MVKRCLTLSLLILNCTLYSDSNVRYEPSLFLEYEREISRSVNPTQNEINPFKKIIAPITPKVAVIKPVFTEVLKAQEPTPKPAIGNDALPYLVINKPVSPSNTTSVSCPTPTGTETEVIGKNDDKLKKSLFEHIHSAKDRILAKAKEFLGTPYGFGGKGKEKTDCSGFTQNVFSQIGIKLPRTAADQSEVGEKVNIDELEVGDLLFYNTYKQGVSHVAIYTGDGHMIHATYLGKKVQIDNINQNYYKQRFLFAKRVAFNSNEMNE